MQKAEASVLWTVLAIFVLQPVCSGTVAAQCAEGNQPVCPVPGYTASTCPIRSDPVIRQSVLNRLAGLVRPPDRVEVCVTDGEVRLTGQVRDQGVKDVVTVVTSTLRGLKCISNEITVVPPSQTDVQLVAAVSRMLGKTPMMARQVHVQASDGVVRLTGTVPSDFVRDQAGLIAGAVAGVIAVQNNIVVRGPGEFY